MHLILVQVKHLFLPPANTFQQTSDYGYIVREEGGVGGGGSDGRLALHKIDLNSMKYVKRLAAVEKSGCIPNRLAFIPLGSFILHNSLFLMLLLSFESTSGVATLDK